jgi:hypothetical protein
MQFVVYNKQYRKMKHLSTATAHTVYSIALPEEHVEATESTVITAPKSIKKHSK